MQNDMKSHTGGVLMMGKGAIHAGSTKQKLNTRSSTEAEIVGVDDLMPQVLWTRYFMEAQGYKVIRSANSNNYRACNFIVHVHNISFYLLVGRIERMG